jgi:hypothetical protein
MFIGILVVICKVLEACALFWPSCCKDASKDRTAYSEEEDCELVQYCQTLPIEAGKAQPYQVEKNNDGILVVKVPHCSDRDHKCHNLHGFTAVTTLYQHLSIGKTVWKLQIDNDHYLTNWMSLNDLKSWLGQIGHRLPLRDSLLIYKQISTRAWAWLHCY